MDPYSNSYKRQSSVGAESLLALAKQASSPSKKGQQQSDDQSRKSSNSPFQPRKSSIRQQMKRISTIESVQNTQNLKQPKQSVRFSDIEKLGLIDKQNSEDEDSQRNDKDQSSRETGRFSKMANPNDGKRGSILQSQSQSKSSDGNRNSQSQKIQNRDSTFGKRQSVLNNQKSGFDIVREESSSGSSSIISDSDPDSKSSRSTSKNNSQKNSLTVKSDQSDQDMPRRNSSKKKSSRANSKRESSKRYGDFYQIQEEPPSQEQTITDSVNSSRKHSDSQSQSNQENEDDDMEFQEDSDYQNSNKFQQRNSKGGRFSKALQQQEDMADLLEIVQKQQNDLLEIFTMKRNQSIVSSSSSQSEVEKVEIDGKIETIFQMLGIQVQDQNQAKNQVYVQQPPINQLNNSTQNVFQEQKKQEDIINNIKQHFGFGPMIDCPSLISEQTNEDQSSSYNSKKTPEGEAQKQQMLSMMTSNNQNQNSLKTQIELINRDIQSSSSNTVKSSSHAQLLNIAPTPQTNQNQSQNDNMVQGWVPRQIPLKVDMKRLQLEILANEERHNQRIYEEYKKNKLLIHQNKKLLDELKEARNVQNDQKEKIEKSLIHIQEYKNKAKLKEEQTQQFKERYKQVKQKYSDFKNRLDEMLIKKSEEVQLKKDKSEKQNVDDEEGSSDLKIENDFLQHQIYTLQNELMIERKQKESVQEYLKKIKFYETMIEDLTYENTKLVIKQRKMDDLSQEKDQLIKLLDQFKAINQKLMKECEDYKHKHEVSEKLRQQLKDFYSQKLQNQLNQDVKLENIMLSQSFIEREVNNQNINFGSTIDHLNFNNDTIQSLDFQSTQQMLFENKRINFSGLNSNLKIDDQSLSQAQIDFTQKQNQLIDKQFSSRNMQNTSQNKNQLNQANNRLIEIENVDDSKQKLNIIYDPDREDSSSPLRNAQKLYGVFNNSQMSSSSIQLRQPQKVQINTQSALNTYSQQQKIQNNNAREVKQMQQNVSQSRQHQPSQNINSKLPQSQIYKKTTSTFQANKKVSENVPNYHFTKDFQNIIMIDDQNLKQSTRPQNKSPIPSSGYAKKSTNNKAA
eukprot:403349649